MPRNSSCNAGLLLASTAVALLASAVVPGGAAIAQSAKTATGAVAELAEVIVTARKGARGPARLSRGLVLHGPDGRYTEAAEAVLRHAAPLEP